jgi:hypothetical protein
MKPALATLALVPFLAASCATVSPGGNQSRATQQESSRSNISLLVGQRSMSDSSDWSPTDDQTMVELGFATPVSDWPVGLEATLSHSKDSSGGFKGETTEGSVGARKTWDVTDGNVHPYVGLGLSWIKAKFSGLGLSDDDTSLAGYAHGGAYYDLTSDWHVGADLRLLFGSDITLFGTNGDADYTQFGIFVGYSF